MRRAAAAAAAIALVLASGACGAPLATRGDARTFTREALADAGLGDVAVRGAVVHCSVAGARGWRTRASTAEGPIALCVSLTQRRALSVRTATPAALTDAQYRRLDRFRSDPTGRRVLAPAASAAALLLAGVAISLTLAWKDRPT